jgi:hypothetical protein
MMKKIISAYEELDNDFFIYKDNGDYVLDPFKERYFMRGELFKSLFQHQVTCIKWLWRLHKEKQV